MLSLSHILVTLGVCLIVGWVMKGVKAPPETMEEEDLAKEGLDKQQIRRELRAQRGEHRQHSTTKSQAMRAVNAARKTIESTFK
jgi:hypothetical protein